MNLSRRAVLSPSGGLLGDIFEDCGAYARREPRRRQHAIDDRWRDSGSLVLAFEQIPGRAARESQRIGLLVERSQSHCGERIPKLPDLRALAFSHCRERESDFRSEELPRQGRAENAVVLSELSVVIVLAHQGGR